MVECTKWNCRVHRVILLCTRYHFNHLISNTNTLYSTLYTPPFQPLHFKHTQTQSILLCTLHHFNHFTSNTHKHTLFYSVHSTISNTLYIKHTCFVSYNTHISILFYSVYTLQFQPLHFKHTQTHSTSNTPVLSHRIRTYSFYFTLYTRHHSNHFISNTHKHTLFQTHLFCFI